MVFSGLLVWFSDLFWLVLTVFMGGLKYIVFLLVVLLDFFDWLWLLFG